MTVQPLRTWMAAVIAAPAIVLAGAGLATAQTNTAPATPSVAPASPAGPAAAPLAPMNPGDRAGPPPPGHHHGHRHGHRGPMGMMGVKPDADGNVARADVVTAQQRQLSMFDKIDANRDGVLSKDERQAFHKAMHDARPPKDPAAAPAPAPVPPKG